MIKDIDYGMLSLSTEELELLLGEGLLSDQIGSKPIRDKEKKEISQRWFYKKLDLMADILCNDHFVQTEILSKKVTDRNIILSTLVDALSSAFGMVPISVLAAMLIKYGLEKLCCEGER